MADGVFNIAKGRTVELYNRVKSNDPTNSAFIVVLLKTSVVDGTLEDFDDLGAIIADAGVVEADFTSYGRKTVTDTELAALPAPDDTGNKYDVDIPDQVWSPAGGAANNTLVKMLICYDADTVAGTDANILPLCHYDFAVTTDGSDLTAQIGAQGFFSAG
jgi:hypothetical protein